MLYLNEEEVKQLLPMAACIDRMRQAFEEIRAGRTHNQPRRRLILETGSVLHQMAGSWGNYFVTKIYSSNRKSGGVVQMINLLYDAESGKPLAYLEANNLGMIRTGAASGYATDLLAAPDASVVGLIGSGWQARGQVEAMRAVRPIKEIRVWSRKLENAETFAEEMNCRAVESAEEAVRDAPIVVTATSSKDPVLESSWIKPGTMINAMGSNVANRREIPADLMRTGRVVVDDLEQAKIEAGDIILADSWANVVELKDVQRGHDPTRVTIFESLGIAVEDAAAAGYVYEQAVAKKIGRQFP